ncbi:MAG: arsenate reductase ArsC [Candidatus Bathyarchaeota archaeon]|nr:arsenate reductase ArsC [Candidatus Bathyarchaeota archaeon]
MQKILFVCVENAGRSQMAEAFTNHYSKGIVAASSAGIKLAEKVNPAAVEAMKEKGINISKNKPKMLTGQMVNEADLIVTMGCGAAEICPGPFFKASVDWELQDPKGQPIEKVRKIRDQIESKVIGLIEQITAAEHHK